MTQESQRTELRFIAKLGDPKIRAPKASSNSYTTEVKGGSIDLPLEVTRPKLPTRPSEPKPDWRLNNYRQKFAGGSEEPTEEALRETWDAFERNAWLRNRKHTGSSVPCEWTGELPDVVTAWVEGNTTLATIVVRCVGGKLEAVEKAHGGRTGLRVWRDHTGDYWTDLSSDQYGDGADGSDEEDEGLDFDHVRCEACMGTGKVSADGSGEPDEAEETKAFEAYSKAQLKEHRKAVKEWGEYEAEFVKSQEKYRERVAVWQAEVATMTDSFQLYGALAALGALLAGTEVEVTIRTMDTDLLPGFGSVFGTAMLSQSDRLLALPVAADAE